MAGPKSFFIQSGEMWLKISTEWYRIVLLFQAPLYVVNSWLTDERQAMQFITKQRAFHLISRNIYFLSDNQLSDIYLSFLLQAIRPKKLLTHWSVHSSQLILKQLTWKKPNKIRPKRRLLLFGFHLLFY